MKRREFLGASCVAAAAAMSKAALGAQPAPHSGNRQLLELRLYQTQPGAMRKKLDKFLAEAAVPAWNRLGIKPVGVFAHADPKVADLYVLLPHEDMESFVTASARLWADAEFLKAAGDALDTPKNAPIYTRIETALLLAFEGAPKVEVPTKAPTRVFQLRIYESHCDERARRKIAMFNQGGELALFRKVGMNPVFFGQRLAGTRMPNLTYMLAFDDEAAQKAAWRKFLTHPEWQKLRTDPQYRDTVSKITNIPLKPTPYSQI